MLDVDSTDDPTHGQQQLSFFKGGYDHHMYHPLLIFERHTGCLLAARLRPGRVVSHARIIPLLLRIVPRLQREFRGVRIKLRADAGFATPLLLAAAEYRNRVPIRWDVRRLMATRLRVWRTYFQRSPRFRT
jgi:Transposase DDE domain group 1